MDVRITLLSNSGPLSQSSSNTSSSKNNNRFITLNTSNQEISRPETYRQNSLQQDRTHLNKSQNLIPAKSISSDNNNSLLLFANKQTNKPLYSMKTTSKVMQPTYDVYTPKGFNTSSRFNTSSSFTTSGATNKKNILLYQQVEREKLFSNRAELVNRFNYKV
ncbi:MAG: hypothetical protein OQK75_08435 [Gammaproteobacteria bacterium]|nr:hypothetical protein [Gammaproteobacteria bacterium]MCW8987681.1 hypothetical protein [Gammaproteobacteria bacterium]